MYWDESEERRKTSKADKELLLRAQNYRCMYCGVSLKGNSAAQVHLDHKRSLKKGGKDTTSNLQALCSKCNQRKSATSDVDFRKKYKKLGLGSSRGAKPPKKRINYSGFDAIDKEVKSKKDKAKRKEKKDKAKRKEKKDEDWWD